MLYVLPSKQWAEYLHLSLKNFFGTQQKHPLMLNDTHTNIDEMITAIVQEYYSNLMRWTKHEHSRSPILPQTEYSPAFAKDRYNRAKARLFPFYLEYLQFQSERGANPYEEAYADILEHVLDPLEVIISYQLSSIIAENTWCVWTMGMINGNVTIEQGPDYRVQYFERTRGI